MWRCIGNGTRPCGSAFRSTSALVPVRPTFGQTQLSINCGLQSVTLRQTDPIASMVAVHRSGFVYSGSTRRFWNPRANHPSYVEKHRKKNVFALKSMHSAAAAVRKKTNKYMTLVQQYGVIVIVFHTGVWALVLAGIFVGLHHDEVDIDYVLGMILPSSMEERKQNLLNAAHSEYGKFAIAYAITLATGPPRLGLSLVATPWLAKRIASMNNPYLSKLLLHNEFLENLFSNPMSIFRRKDATTKSATEKNGAKR